MRQHPHTLPQSTCGPARSASSSCASSARAGAYRRAAHRAPHAASHTALHGDPDHPAGGLQPPAEETATPVRPGRRRALTSSLIAFALAVLLWLPQILSAAAAPPLGPVNPEDPTTYRDAPKQQSQPGAAIGGPDQPRGEILHYTVQAGDTLYGIAEQYNVSVETLIWANRLEANPAMLHLGQELLILPVSGVLHTIQSGDTLLGIAGKYKGDVDAMVALAANHLSGTGALLQIGQQIIVPGGVKPKAVVAPSPAVQPATSAPAPANAPQGSARFAWPVRGAISQRFYYYHPGIDIGDPTGTPVVAADSGYVAVAGWSNVGYGNYIVIDHGNGSRTLYGHLSRIDVKAGQPVKSGQQIGAVGATGNATGPHLHFEVHQNGAAHNPLDLLP